MSAMTFEDRFRGGLWGLFVGDALAMPVYWVLRRGRPATGLGNTAF